MELQHAADSLLLLANPVAMATHHFLAFPFSHYVCTSPFSELIRNNPGCASAAAAVEVRVEMKSQAFSGSRRASDSRCERRSAGLGEAAARVPLQRGWKHFTHLWQRVKRAAQHVK